MDGSSYKTDKMARKTYLKEHANDILRRKISKKKVISSSCEHFAAQNLLGKKASKIIKQISPLKNSKSLG